MLTVTITCHSLLVLARHRVWRWLVGLCVGFGGFSIGSLCGSVLMVSRTSFSAIIVEDVGKVGSNNPRFAQELIQFVWVP